MTAHHERPMAAAGLTSYRCRGRYGWIMIGATDAADAMREARRSTANPRPEDLEVWDGTRYVPAAPGATLTAAQVADVDETMTAPA